MNRNPATILLVEDEAVLRRVFRTLLEASGYRVREAGTADEALVAIAAQKPSLVLLDLGLPDGSGLDVARILRADAGTADIRIVAMTGRSGPETKRSVLEIGCLGLLVKPIEPGELLRQIGTWLDGPTSPPTNGRAETPA
ncbi:MAG: response regulator [Longimicrobiales bacterium]